MQLTLSHLDNYVRLIRPKLSPEEQEKTKQSIEAQVESGQRNLSLTRIALDKSGEIGAAISLSAMGDD
ncbi:MAG: hypothetical protein P1V97_30905, partial [Planctomycetota bacterium]|nr:hypothetical protein [Planctomycetota bacterium]